MHGLSDSPGRQPGIAGIILAAGGSSRFGAVKQLLPWGRGTCLEACVRTAELAGLDPIVVVLGFQNEIILDQTQLGHAQVVKNAEWDQGQGASLKAGVGVLPEGLFGAVFMLADQPQISVNLVMAIKELAWKRNSVVVPLINDQRANPVFFPSRAFSRLSSIQGDQGGRALMGEFPTVLLPWLDEDMALDIDTQADYDRLCRIFFTNPS